MFGLIDCNSFFASCEQVFRPDLYGKPVIVLSNNDGCIIAMTKEAKAYGIHRGQPLYQIREVIEKNNIAVFSSNYSLYDNISHRVMQMVSERVHSIDIYSIDEAFMDLNGYDINTLSDCMHQLSRDIRQGIGIPVSIGIAPTKTLAKIASIFAKRYRGYQNVCIIDTEEKRIKALHLIPIEDIWGIGRRISKNLINKNVYTAWDLTQKNETWVQKNLNITGVRTWKELHGISCINTLELSEKKNICTSRSFSEMVEDYPSLSESVATFAASCAMKLRKQHTAARLITVTIMTNKHREDLPQYFNTAGIRLDTPSCDSMEIVQTALKALRSIYKEGYKYKKSAVVVSDILRQNEIQPTLFDDIIRKRTHIKLSNVIDKINQTNGIGTMKLAVQGNAKNKWGLKREYISPNYTTNFKEILKVN